jgi:hypothetical protein
VTGRQLRALRGASASGVATLLAAVSHTIGGGAAPAPALVAAMAAVLTLPAMLLMGSRHGGILRLIVTVCAAQAAFHTVFFALGSPTATTVAPHAGHDHAGMLAALLASTDPGGAALPPDGAMLLTHAIAAALTIAVLHRGERVVRAIAAWAFALVARSADVVALPCLPPLRRAAGRRRAASRVFHGIVPQRGPPVPVLG